MVRVTHPFHPWFGREFVLLGVRGAWSQDRVFFLDADGRQFSLPTAWTDAAGPDVFMTIADDGVPVGLQVVLVDNSDTQNVTATGTWPGASTAGNRYGPDYQTNAAGTGADTFAWNLNIPQAGTYEVFARFPTVAGAATDAKYTVAHGGGSTVATVNQNNGAGTWVSLGSYAFTEGNTHKVTLTDQANGTVTADAVKLVRNNGGQTDTEKHDYRYAYDPNGNLSTITDSSPGARVDTYAIAYTELNQAREVLEKLGSVQKNKTTFGYDPNGALLNYVHDKQRGAFEYDPRNMVKTVTNTTADNDPDPKVTTYTYTDRGERLHEVKANGNTVDYTYYLDGLLRTQVERKPDTTVVSEHTIDYDLNGNRTRDVTRNQNADNHSAHVSTTTVNTFDPRDRVAQVTKTGDGAGTESYIHDANNNVVTSTVKNVTTNNTYDRNRLRSATAGGATSTYNYDPFGRLDTVTSGGTVAERNLYDGFDHIVENRKTGAGTTKYTFDPMDRTSTKTTDAGTAEEETTTFSYLGLTGEVLDEEAAGAITKSYQFSPWGERVSQVTHNTDGTKEDAFYGYSPHTDVEQLTDDTGNTKATYGYTAYGSDDETRFTGVDKPDTADPTKEPYNAYRFNAKRWDSRTGSYDMGFRDYSPGLNRFLSRDSYNGALSDMNLGLNPYTGNRYAFAGGNPITGVELDGHMVVADGGGGGGGGVPPPCSDATPEYCHDPGSNDTNVYGLFWLWAKNEFLGLGDLAGCRKLGYACPSDTETVIMFRDGDPFTEEIRELDSIERARQSIAAKLAQGSMGDEENFHYADDSPSQRAKTAINNALSIFTDGALGMPRAQSFIGSYDMTWEVVGYEENGDPVVEFYLTNASTLWSGNPDPNKVRDYGEENRCAGCGEDAQIGEHWLQQRVRWRETFPGRQAPQRPGQWIPVLEPLKRLWPF